MRRAVFGHSFLDDSAASVVFGHRRDAVATFPQISRHLHVVLKVPLFHKFVDVLFLERNNGLRGLFGEMDVIEVFIVVGRLRFIRVHHDSQNVHTSLPIDALSQLALSNFGNRQKSDIDVSLQLHCRIDVTRIAPQFILNLRFQGLKGLDEFGHNSAVLAVLAADQQHAAFSVEEAHDLLLDFSLHSAVELDFAEEGHWLRESREGEVFVLDNIGHAASAVSVVCFGLFNVFERIPLL